MSNIIRQGTEEPFELDFRVFPEFGDAAKAAVAAAVEELETQYPSNPNADSKLRARRKRVFGAWRNGFEMVDLAVVEYLTREKQQRASMPIPRMLEELTAAIRAAKQLQNTAGEMEGSLLASQLNQRGSEICDLLTMAKGDAIDALQALLVVQEAMRRANQLMPKVTSGAGGAIGRLRSYSSDVALFFKLEKMWIWAGLTSRTGQSGDGLDVFLRHALRAANHQKCAKANWLEKLREKAKREQSLVSHENITQ